jgi:hypothetical protein
MMWNNGDAAVKRYYLHRRTGQFFVVRLEYIFLALLLVIHLRAHTEAQTGSTYLLRLLLGATGRLKINFIAFQIGEGGEMCT